MDRGARQATVHKVTESDMSEVTYNVGHPTGAGKSLGVKLLGAPSPTLDFFPDALEAILSFVQVPWEHVFYFQHGQLPIAFHFQSPLLLKARGLSNSWPFMLLFWC